MDMANKATTIMLIPGNIMLSLLLDRMAEIWKETDLLHLALQSFVSLFT